MRTRSPSNAPPLDLDEGSTAITPTALPALRQAATSAAHVEQRLGLFAFGIALQVGKRGRQGPLAAVTKRQKRHSVLSGPPSAAWAAASRAIGTR